MQLTLNYKYVGMQTSTVLLMIVGRNLFDPRSTLSSLRLKI